eukprot:TRINITY_DN1166_c2_g1_i1.p2 TRINITY_DN1166_c2_g1~~TRINITY_DN1166_c2_g1_i1.p2  ORF type:complete len:108 (+),score=1.06 TRINITY_DN1166_c2_g1_i1:126-449(+)
MVYKSNDKQEYKEYHQVYYIFVSYPDTLIRFISFRCSFSFIGTMIFLFLITKMEVTNFVCFSMESCKFQWEVQNMFCLLVAFVSLENKCMRTMHLQIFWLEVGRQIL